VNDDYSEGTTPMVDSPNKNLIPLELDYRANDGVEVSLLWHKPTNRLTVSVHDAHSGEQFELEVASDYALDAFHHPYAYAYSRGLVHSHSDPVHA
jgi:hypothetical protein